MVGVEGLSEIVGAWEVGTDDGFLVGTRLGQQVIFIEKLST